MPKYLILLPRTSLTADSSDPLPLARVFAPARRYDENNHSIDKPGDPSKRAFTYFVLTGGRVIYASALRLAVLKFLLSMSASADVLALASLEVDLGKIESGQTVTVKWRGKPVFIRRRTPAEIERENAVDVGSLRDPQADGERATNPEWLVAVGVCTHSDVPISNAGDFNGWFCPCHGSHYDASGRIRKGPAVHLGGPGAQVPRRDQDGHRVSAETTTRSRRRLRRDEPAVDKTPS